MKLGSAQGGPEIEFNFLSHPADVERSIRLLRDMARLAHPIHSGRPVTRSSAYASTTVCGG